MKNLDDKTIAEKIVIVSYLLESVVSKTVLEPLELTMSGYKILHILNEYGEISISRIIACLGSTKSNVSQRLNFLEKNNYIKRDYDSSDKRRVLVLLTEHGQKKFREAQKCLTKKSLKFEELFLEKEIKAMSKFLDKVFKKLLINLKS